MKKKLLITLIVSVVLVAGIVQAYASGLFTKVSDLTMRGMPGGILIKEKNEGDRIITGGYILKGDNIEKITIEKKNITINKGQENEYNFELVKLIKDGVVVSIRPGTEGGAHNLVVGNKKVLFTDAYEKGLWICDKNILEPVSIQPDSVGTISQQELMKKKEALAAIGKDIDEIILYWVSSPKLAPNESKVAFTSNRLGYPYNLNSALFITDLNGNTSLIIDETTQGSVVPIGWTNDDTIIFKNSKGELKKVSLSNKEITTLVSNEVMVTGISIDGNYVIYQYSENGLAKPEHFMFNVMENKETAMALPQGYKSNGFYGWDNSNVAFYAQDFNGDIKLLRMNCKNGDVTAFDAPEGTKFDIDIVPSWAEGKILFSAGGKLYSTK